MSLDPNAPQPSEPLLTVGTVTAAATAVIDLVVAFGVRLSTGQDVAIIGVVSIAAPIVVAVWGRRKVFSPATVARLLNNPGAGHTP